FLVGAYVNNGFLIVMISPVFVNNLFLINNTKEVLVLLLVLNSFLTNVISLVTKKSAILWA
ncbi:hypothetical protein, partial [Klebsiella oxytoca]|uniref:hypothetical protein n=1 Tax=Klebsiella oxytoca TaxID=571 RepID=UPI001CCEB399